MNKLFLFLLSIFLLNLNSISAQLQVANWYFGNKAGLNFNVANGAMPNVVFNGQLKTLEGCSTISDPNGQLLFYTDGIEVYNRNHQIMPNGTNLSGDPSSSQSGIIVPNPSDNGIYYIFTVSADDTYNDPSDGSLQGLEYSVVDMSANGGLGDVVSLNTHLTLEAGNPNLCSEKVTAVNHFNQHDVWVITHLRDKFYSFLVTDAGVNPTPVITTIAPMIIPDGFVVNARGYLKASPNGKYLAIAHYSNLQPSEVNPSSNNTVSGNSRNGIVGLYDFNNQTGTLSNYREMSGVGTPYGIEFSPNSEYLYAELDYFQNPGTSTASWAQGKIIQWKLSDMSSFDVVHITNATPSLEVNWPPVASVVTQIGFTTRMRGALQLGIDGRIYYAKSHYYETGSSLDQFREPNLSVIQKPNLQGAACDFQVRSFPIDDPNGANPATDYDGSNHYVTYGLPPFITSYFNNNVEIETENICEGEAGVFNLIIDESVENITQIEWDMGDGTQYLDQETINHIYQSAGEYLIEVKLHIGTDGLILQITQPVTVHPKPNLQNASLQECDTSDIDGLTNFNLSEANPLLITSGTTLNYTFEYYLTQADAENQLNPLPVNYTNISNPQTLYVRVATEFDCYNIAELELTVSTDRFILNNMELCDDESNDGVVQFNLSTQTADIEAMYPNQSVSYHLTELDAINNQNNIPNIASYSNTSIPQTIFVRVGNGNECTAIGEFDLIVLPSPVLEIADQAVCSGEEVTFDAGPGFASYVWSTGSTQQSITVSAPGTYTVTVSNGDCEATESMVLSNPFSTPVLQNTSLTQCDDNPVDGIAQFDLSTAIPELIVTPNGNNITSDFYLTQTDAENETNALPNLYTNISNPQTVFVRVTNENGCFDIAELELIVTFDTFDLGDYVQCDGEENDGVAQFDLTSYDANLLATYQATDVFYFLSEQDALLNQNPINNSSNYSNTSNPQTIFVRVVNGINCTAIGEVDLQVLVSPVLEIEDQKVCPDTQVTFDAGPGFASYLWSTGSTAQSINVIEPGTYTVTVSNGACETTESMELINVQPVINSVEVDGNVAVIHAIGEEPLEYSIDNINWQASNTFSGLPFGIFSAYVRDAFGCEADGFLFSILTLPNIITPNGDGINDQWNVKGLDIYPGTVIEIYDRYGKLVHTNTVPEVYPPGTPIEVILNDPTPYYAWDGKYLGRAVPSTSYWYRVHIPDGRILNGYLVVKNRDSVN